jgi:asparagine synthase (glutamine-hydrolysing)
MCGVAAASVHRSGWSAVDLVERMVAAQRHRGPDGQGWVGCPQAAVGMSRLRIRSRSDDQVPFTRTGADEAFAYCGEVYALSSSAGTTVPAGGLGEALAAFQGHDGRADGMYALARLAAGAEIRLVRDRYGIKPLYLRDGDGWAAAASELPALLAAGGVPAVRPEAIAQLLYAGCLVDGGTCFAGVRPVRPGEHLVLRHGRVVASTLSEGPPRCGVPDDRADLRAAIADAVHASLAADRQVGLAVSGGLDSTILATELARAGIRDLRTVSVRPDGTGDGVAALFDLGLPAGRTATWSHLSVPFRPDQLLDGLHGVVATIGEPSMLTSSPMYAVLARTAAAHGIVVLLLGEGADELFGGYRSYVQLVRRGLTATGFYAPPARTALVTELIGTDLFAAARDALAATAGRAEDRLRTNGGRAPSAAETVRELEPALSLEPLLRRADHLLMSEGIEGRTPLLHGRVPGIAASYRMAELVSDGRTKVALAEAYRGIVPDAIRDSAKRPFRAPLRDWFGGPLSRRVRAELLSSVEALESVGVCADAVRRLADTPVTDASATMRYRLLTLAHWVRWLAAVSPTPEGTLR